MSLSNRTERLRRPRRSVLPNADLDAFVIAEPLLSVGMAVAHICRDFDGLPRLFLPVAPDIPAVTPEHERAGIASGAQRLTMSRNG